jgi:hypothetical protein
MRAMLKPAIGLAVIALVAAAAIAKSVHWQHPRSSTYGGLTVRHPQSWRNVGVSFITGAIVQPLGFLTNQRPVKQCRRDVTGQIVCGLPVAVLAANGVLISFRAEPLPTRAFKPDATVAGLPAMVRRGSPRACPVGAGYEMDATLRTPAAPSAGDFGAIELTACLGSATSAQARNDLETMLRTATYRS